MEKFTLSSAMGNLKQNLWLLVSLVGALCLFLAPSTTVIMLEAAVFLVVVLAIALGDAPVRRQRPGLPVLVLAAAFVVTGFATFYRIWMASSYTTILCAIVHMPARKLVPALAALGSIGGCYALYRLAAFFDRMTASLFSGAGAGLKANWFFPLSAACFFWMESEMAADRNWPGVLIAAAAALLVAARAEAMGKTLRKDPPALSILSLLTAAGICLFRRNTFVAAFAPSLWLSIGVGILALPFVWICTAAFFRKLQTLLADAFRDVARWEWAVWGVLLLAVAAFVTVTFLRTDAFYGTAYPYDVIYTSDSPMLVRDNAYLSLNFQENDLRQPLFAVFAAPFMGIPYLLSTILHASAPANALLMNYAQLALLFFTTFLLTKLLELSAVKRLCFLALSCCSYPVLLFSLMMEQYIVAYFYLILFLYVYCTGKQPQTMTLWGAGGTLLTSVIVTPLLSEKNPLRDFRGWFRDMLGCAMGFVFAMLLFGRVDVILDVATSILELTQFTGKELTFADKLHQYTAFIPACFFAPAAGIAPNMEGAISWQMAEATALNWVGIGIVLIALGSAVLTHKKSGSLIAVGWIGFSFLVLVILGWGTQENGLILYALYFGWAFLVLLFRLLEKLEDLAQVKFLVPAVSILAAALMILRNFPAIGEMLAFARNHFPL